MRKVVVANLFVLAAVPSPKIAKQLHIPALPYILESGETVEYVSLGAGNTGRQFDLETNYRVAEFKFIHWRGGAESIRQNQLFKDFYLLAENETIKRKYLYVLGAKFPLHFLNGGRKLNSVLTQEISGGVNGDVDLSGEAFEGRCSDENFAADTGI